MRFSVIIPVYNAEKYLERCLRSVLEQEYKDYEILLINDGSQDASANICSEFAGKYPCIHYADQSNSGPSAARNAGVRMATGDYLLFLDSDDSIKKGSLEKLDDFISKYDPDGIISPLQIIHTRNTAESIEALPVTEKIICGKSDAVLTEMASRRFSTPASKVVIKRQIVVDHQVLFPLEYHVGEDIFMMTQGLCMCEHLLYNPDPYYRYYQNEDSITHTISYAKISKTMSLCEAMYCRAGMLSQAKRNFQHTQMSMMLINFLQYYGKFTAEQKSAIKCWLQNNKQMVGQIAATHPVTAFTGRIIGAGNAFLLAGYVVGKK